MNLLNLVNVIGKKMSLLNVEANLCTKLISPKSTCNSCANHCPMNSISFAKKEIVIDDNCIGCGICAMVCPTGALLANHPPLTQVVQEAIRKSQEHETVYLYCERMPAPSRAAATVSVPCLGMIPKEGWVTLLNRCQNLSVYQPDGACGGCDISTGEKVWRSELQAAEAITSTEVNFTSHISDSKDHVPYDAGRRDFLSSFFKEVKTTNKLAISELLGGSTKIPSYQEKIKADSVSKLKKELNEVGHHLFEKMTNETTYPYMTKRSLFLAEVEGNEALRHQEDSRLPEINEECNFCGACAILCPTEALTMKSENGLQTITLKPEQCVDCSLCEEICYFKSIKLQPVQNQALLEKEVLLR
ncbi:4Fe-4S dicluster domain-containing protein [Neobacillus notoginsengisoli]|uniref:4Fe-4S dicluster domain-containing protein n=1 Tax=Neobacillus notoginsengisoli TaxID=1578198 RepID=A0A417Z072_9BACI|nr:4Fe-4S binding protein [Neobacillus notoginsengisoli]RHW43549.1 4Fe-4S dicluster domain-containing protein [Neobacillus notoginsengisoli]